MTVIDKKKIRQKYLSIRNSMSVEEVKTRSEKIFQLLTAMEVFKNANAIHTYLPIIDQREVNTIPIINHCFELDKIVVVPKIEPGKQLSHHRVNSLNNLKKNKWGVPESIDRAPFPVSDIDFVIVPMVCGDRYRNRIGYGQGFYDRFLNGIDAVKAGLLYDCTLSDEKLPAEPFDQKPDYLVTESQIIS